VDGHGSERGAHVKVGLGWRVRILVPVCTMEAGSRQLLRWPVSRGRVKRSTGRHNFAALHSGGAPGVHSRGGAARRSVVSHGLEIYWYLKCGPMG
jgi:hypothetical protein